jgi:hypothetical protein
MMMAQARKTRMDKSPNFRVALEVTTIKIFRLKTVTLLTRTPSNHLMSRAGRLPGQQVQGTKQQHY